MRLPDVLSATESTARWWTKWRLVNFSWRSLETLMLQEFWRTDPASGKPRADAELATLGELETDPHGNLWHVAHIPLHWDDGTPTWKADRYHSKWRHFWEIIHDHLQPSIADPNAFIAHVDLPDLSGVVFGDFPESWIWCDSQTRLDIRLARCAFLGRVSFAGLSASALDLRYSLFTSIADIDGVAIIGDLLLTGSTFLSLLQLSGVSIRGTLDLSSCDFYGEVSLLGADIDGEFQCNLSIFNAPCGFERTTFRAAAKISWCRFLNVTSFASIRCRGDMRILQSVFNVDVAFTGRCYKNFSCIDCEMENAFLGWMSFRGEALFARTRFKDSARFQNVRFGGATTFLNASFDSDVDFEDVIFRSAIDFHNTSFRGAADFTSSHFPDSARLHHGAFAGAEFCKTADFTMDTFSAWGAFGSCTFHQRVLFSRRALGDPKSFAVAFDAAARTVAETAQEDPSREAEEKYRRFSELEAAFQALKLGMTHQQARLDEHRFYRLELLARRRHASAKIERGAIWLYDVSSLCGTTFVRPLLILFVLVPLFALYYWVAAPSNRVARRSLDANFVDALRFSVENTLQPMSVWKDRSQEKSPRAAWVTALLNQRGALWYLSIRLIATLQSLTAVGLVFLGALAFKRHFQVST